MEVRGSTGISGVWLRALPWLLVLLLVTCPARAQPSAGGAAGQNPPTTPGSEGTAPAQAADAEDNVASDPGNLDGDDPDDPDDLDDPDTEASTAAQGSAGVESDAGPSASEPKTPAHVTYTLQAIEVRGNRKTRTAVVLRYVPFEPGDVLDVDDPRIELTRYRLLGTGFFRDVQFSLRKGSTRGEVVFVIDVDERNTIVVNDLWMGLASVIDRNESSGGQRDYVTAYSGVDVAETNLAGTGITLGGALAISEGQFALRARFLDPATFDTPWMTSGTLFFNDGRDYFGNGDVKAAYSERQTKLPSVQAAIVELTRFGGSLGVGRDLSLSTQLWVNYSLESIDATPPEAASHLRGTDRRVPILFDIQRGKSVLSTLRATLLSDTRDSPFLPTTGSTIGVNTELSLTPAGSDYSYVRFDVDAARWWRLPWNHVVQLRGFFGAIGGDPPFFEQYYVGDLDDFLPSRVLGLAFDQRPPPNLLGTNIDQVRYGRYAAKLSAEYRLPVYRGSRSVYGIDFFLGAGIFGLANPIDFSDPAPGRTGLARIPVDLSGNLGLRIDTSAGGFSFAFSNFLGLIPGGN